MTTRIFVVDDDKHYARLLSYRLDKSKDHDVSVFHSGEDALDALDRERPDVLFLDIMMPGIGGMETLRRFQLLAPDLPVVMISAQGTADVAVEAMKGGPRTTSPRARTTWSSSTWSWSGSRAASGWRARWSSSGPRWPRSTAWRRSSATARRWSASTSWSRRRCAAT